LGAVLYCLGGGDAMTHQAGEYYLASDDLIFVRSIRREEKLFSYSVQSCHLIAIVGLAVLS